MSKITDTLKTKYTKIKSLLLKTNYGLDFVVHAYRIVRDNYKYLLIKEKPIVSEPYDFNFICSNLRRDVCTDGKNTWQNRKETYLEFVKKEKPSILCMQEVMPHMAKFLASNLNYKYDCCGFEREFGCKLHKTIMCDKEGLAIMYDRDRYIKFDEGVFWLSDKPNRPSKLWGINDKRICVYLGLIDKVTSEAFYVFNGHFHHEAEQLLLKSAEHTVEQIKQITGGLNSVFCADLNDYWNSANMKPFDDYYTNKTGDCGYTFNSFNKPFKTIDAIYFNGDYNVTLYNGNYGRPLSDHYPLGIK